MKKSACNVPILCSILMININYMLAQNPLIMDQFTADPSARVFEGKVYIYPSHDIPCQAGQGFIGFCMKDYHVFSSENLTDWEDHGVIISQEKVEWVDSTTYSLWAPDCIYRDGRYYFYFPAWIKDTSAGRGMFIGVATSDKPYGPFKPEPYPIPGVTGIDPNPFIDKDGQAYLYWAGMQQISMAKLKDNMKELTSAPEKVKSLPEGFKEGPYLFEHGGNYYFTFPHVINKTESLAYAVGDNPMGPFKYMGVIMDESPTGCWTNHQSILEYKGQWYLFYHHNDLSPGFDKNRSICADSLFFNADGSIQKVIPTLRGVGITHATRIIQIDRYSAISEKGVSIAFLDTLKKQKGWKAILNSKHAWIRYNSVDFGNKGLTSVKAKALSKNGGILEIRMDNINGPVIAGIELTEKTDWGIFDATLSEIPAGIHNLVVLLTEGKNIEIDWISFK
jgi:hypothetical protein